MWIKIIFMSVISASFGLIVSAGVFTVLIAVGLIPRFAGKTHTADHVVLYEECVIAGTIIGGIFSIYTMRFHIGIWMLILIGLFGGVFVGCLALAIAEMLDTIPIFARRIGFRYGLGCAILAVALGKSGGSFIYFWQRLGIG